VYGKRCVGILRSIYRRSRQMPACPSWVSHVSVSMQLMLTRWSQCSATSRTPTPAFNSSWLCCLARHLSMVSDCIVQVSFTFAAYSIVLFCNRHEVVMKLMTVWRITGKIIRTALSPIYGRVLIMASFCNVRFRLFLCFMFHIKVFCKG